MSRVLRALVVSVFSFAINMPSVSAQQAQDPGAAPAPQKMDKDQKRKAKKALKERNAFLQLDTNEEREQFIEQFWLRRSSNPDLPDNDFKEEHYRRIAYTNEHFASGIPGWKTD